MNDMCGQNNGQYNQNNFMSPNNFGYRIPKYEIIKVNGEAGARNFRMAPNSSALLADETAAIVWFEVASLPLAVIPLVLPQQIAHGQYPVSRNCPR